MLTLGVGHGVSAQTQGDPLAEAEAEAVPAPLGLMGTIPIYWGEAEGMAEQLAGDSVPHWAKPVLAGAFNLGPLDYLTANTLSDYPNLLLAQPRGLSPEENVALDQWVRGGGRLLMFADPWMTGESEFNIGDRRRPQGVVLLSPILTHWGLNLGFDSRQENTLKYEPIGEGELPVNSPGRFELISQDGVCVISETGILADCAIGEGRAVILADGAILDLYGPHSGAPEGLLVLLSKAFGADLSENGENAGGADFAAIADPENGGNPRVLGVHNLPIMTGGPPE